MKVQPYSANESVKILLLYFTFSHLADAFIQSDLQIRKSNQNWKWKLCKY